MNAARTFVVGDIHGCVDEVNRLLDALDLTAADTVVFLGDYIDRGPSPKSVIERLVRLQQQGPRCVFLKGNHEDMFLAYLGRQGNYGEAFLFNGGEATLRSYGMEASPGILAADQLPPEHLEFLLSLQMRFEHPPFYCLHAGLVPTRPLADQRDEDLLWVRDEFISNAHPFPFTVLFGHTPQRDVLLDPPYKIGLDTGLVYWNKLSCLELEELELFQIRRGDRQVLRRNLREAVRQARRERPVPQPIGGRATQPRRYAVTQTVSKNPREC